MQVDFEIHHVVDRPGRLVEILSDHPDGGGIAETLCAGANGVGVVVGTRLYDPAEHVRFHGPSGRSPAGDGVPTSLRGTARPNPTFEHGSAARFEAVISIEDEPRRILLRHGLALRDAMHEVARVALREQAPLLSLQCPAQIPPHTHRQETGRTTTRAVERSRSSSLALRFSMALPRERAEVRLRIADRLAGYCAEKGLGLWLADTRAGYRTGDWFIVHPHDRAMARARYDPDRQLRGGSAEGVLPVTLVGPARFGSTHAVVAFLAQFPSLGVLACSMTPLDDLAFTHLQLAVNGASRARLAALNRGFAARRATGTSPADVLPHVVSDLLGGEPPSDAALDDARRLLARAGDYQTMVGPALPVVPDNGVWRVPIWFAWQMREADPGLQAPITALTEAADELGLAPTIEYLVCRLVGTSALRGKGKLAVPKQVLDERFPATRYATGPARLCSALEEGWRARLAASGGGGGTDVSGLTVSWRESWLGHWT